MVISQQRVHQPRVYIINGSNSAFSQFLFTKSVFKSTHSRKDLFDCLEGVASDPLGQLVVDHLATHRRLA